MVVFSYIWQALMVVCSTGCAALSIWAASNGEVAYTWIFALYILVFALHFATGHFWRKTARCNARTRALLRDDRP